MSVTVIFPSAGHHNADPGAVYNGRKEAEEMKCFRDLVIAELQAKGHKPIADRDDETASQHQSRIKPGNGSVVAEFHLDAVPSPTATGTTAVVKRNPTPLSMQMGQELVNTTARILGIRNRGVITEDKTNRGRIGIVNKPGTAVLLELGFLSNPSDMAAFDANKVALAKAIAEILIKYDALI